MYSSRTAAAHRNAQQLTKSLADDNGGAADFITFQRFHLPGSDHLAKLCLVPWDHFKHTSCLQLVIPFARPFLTIIECNAIPVCSP